ncbi:MAG: vanadium-dependent haloperoxidase, partial [Chthoniobacteraceae bacterium]
SNEFAEVDPNAYQALLLALETGKPAHFEAIPHATLPVDARQKFVNPQSALAFDLQGADSHALTIPAAPAFASAEAAGEIIELYWMALTRDIAFTDYEVNPLIQTAAADLSRLSDFCGPRIGGIVTPQTLFRDNLIGATAGPYLSQFLLLPVPFGATAIDQRIRTVVPGIDFMTNYGDWLNIQRGENPQESSPFDSTRRFIRNGRDLTQWVHVDVLFQAYFHALLILLAPPDAGDPNSGGIGAPLDDGNPYRDSLNQVGFGTFGGPHVAALMCEVATRALKSVWYQKWAVHRRVRPEAFAGRVHLHFNEQRSYPLAVGEFQKSDALDLIYDRTGAYLLPLAFPEGSPMHPSYGAGHATVAGACVTILKAFFDESFPIPDPVVPTPDGLALSSYQGSSLTVGGELNKLASNIATGRNHSGVHWRTDAASSLRLGEEVAISVLRDQKLTFNEKFDGFSLTRFDGTRVVV